MNRYTVLDIPGYEEVVRCDNTEVGFTSWIAVHNSNRGPALGGCRVWSYAREEDALVDVLRLSKGMTYKNSLARLPLGGGKSVVFADLSKVERVALFEAVGRFVDTLGGRYITAEDVNSTVEDMVAVKRFTRHVATVGASGNPSPFTAYGVYCAIRACVKFRYNRESTKGMVVAIQGVGETGGRLAELLVKDGCSIIASDINRENIAKLRERISFEEVSPDAIYEVPCDIFSPCALGGTLNSMTIPKLQCAIVAGSANNQLLEEIDGNRLFDRDILYAPDYAVNAGGVINISCEIDQDYDPERAKTETAKIGETVLDILRQSKSMKLPTHLIANRMAEELFGMQRAA
ncbi:Glu/Leu/Phe/Val family dehydrogenase [Desulfopila aestuarii]|uniref:Leucine dehydrogenase n=1 Tax=Desulfopila aestuarii DSM 18488 TaxID=1121416 RepID=A0A1M7Y5A3_9BACT|nr:Glu/Leu/Phe/Val dehydrogenase dimerization domain-containing protein [Desulfopila aestuarii]SHO47537.1 leucine dehydrogenase [Desulfopila aestuarii DSM 18488]